MQQTSLRSNARKGNSEEIIFAPLDGLTLHGPIVRATRDQVTAFGVVIQTEGVR